MELAYAIYSSRSNASSSSSWWFGCFSDTLDWHLLRVDVIWPMSQCYRKLMKWQLGSGKGSSIRPYFFLWLYVSRMAWSMCSYKVLLFTVAWKLIFILNFMMTYPRYTRFISPYWEASKWINFISCRNLIEFLLLSKVFSFRIRHLSRIYISSSFLITRSKSYFGNYIVMHSQE